MMRVLLIERNVFAGQATAAMLIGCGHEVFGPYRTRRMALGAARAGCFDLAIVDVDLAGDCNGTVVARSLYHGRRIPVLFVGARAGSVEHSRHIAIGTIHRPFTGEMLNRCITYVSDLLDGAPEPGSPPVGLELFTHPSMEGRRRNPLHQGMA